MSELIQLVYASRANFAQNTGAAVELEVGRILRASRSRNGRANIGGVLYCGDGVFFQCLEGPAEQVVETYARIKADARHKGVSLLLQEKISRAQFDRWSMKYVSTERAVQAFLKSQGMDQFNPFSLDRTQVRSLLDFLHGREEVPLKTALSWWQRLPLVGRLFSTAS